MASWKIGGKYVTGEFEKREGKESSRLSDSTTDDQRQVRSVAFENEKR